MPFLPRLPISIICRCLVVWIVGCAAICAVTVPSAKAQLPQAIDIREENPERRKILQLIEQLETIERDQYLSAADAFDAAWEMAVRREDPLLNLNTDVQEVLEPGQSELYAGARARLQHTFETAPAAFRQIYREQVSSRAQETLDAAIESSNVDDLTQVILRYQFTEAGQQALQSLIRLRLSRGELLQAALQYGRLLRLRGDQTPDEKVKLATLWWRAGLPEEAIDELRDLLPENRVTRIFLSGQNYALPNS